MRRKIKNPEAFIKAIDTACNAAYFNYDEIWDQEEYQDPKFKAGVRFFAWSLHELMAIMSDPIEDA